MPTVDGGRIKALREAAGLSQKALGEMAGVTQPTIQKIESGRARLSRHDTIANIARVFRLTVEDLLADPAADDAPEATVAAGTGSPADVEPGPATDDGLYRFVVTGDCLHPKIQQGWTVGVRPGDAAGERSGRFVVALVNGERVVKMLQRGDGWDFLVALDGRPPIAISPNARIIGVVERVEHDP